MFNLLTNNKLNESYNPPHHLSRSARNLFLYFFNSIPPPLSIQRWQQPGEIGKFKYLCIFIIFQHVLDIFSIRQTKNIHYYLYSNRRKFPNFREFRVIQSKKIRSHFSLYFQSYSQITALLVNFSKKSFQADKSPASLIRKFPSHKLSVRVFLILPNPFKTSRMAVQRPSINLSRRWFNDHHISKKINK